MVRSNIILCAEDDEHYVELLTCCLKQAGFGHELRHVIDGSQAMAYLKGEGEYVDRKRFPVPALVLADLKMPRVNGLELLDWIRRRSPYRTLPVVMLTCSDEIKDIKQAYELGANSFLVKPPRVEDLREMVKMLDAYWLRFNVRT